MVGAPLTGGQKEREEPHSELRRQRRKNKAGTSRVDPNRCWEDTILDIAVVCTAEAMGSSPGSLNNYNNDIIIAVVGCLLCARYTF